MYSIQKSVYLYFLLLLIMPVLLYIINVKNCGLYTS